MNSSKFILAFLVLVVVVCGVLADDGLSRHKDHVGQIDSLLKGIEANLANEEAKVNEQFAEKEKLRLKALEEAEDKLENATSAKKVAEIEFTNANKQFSTAKEQNDKLDELEEKAQQEALKHLENERRLIRMLREVMYNNFGTSESTPAISCEQVFDLGIDRKPGYYWITLSGKATKVYCTGKNMKHVLSGSCNKHNTGGGWDRICLDTIDYNTATDLVERVQDSGIVKILKSGYYRINAKTMSHGSSWGSQHGRVLLNGQTISYNYDTSHNWMEHRLDVIWPMKEGDAVEVQWYSTGGSEYKWHSSGAAAGYNRFQISYEGAASPSVSVGCHTSTRSAGWIKACNNEFDYNNADSVLSVGADGTFTALVDGLFRFNARAMQYSNGYGNHHGRLMVNNQQVSYFHNYAYQWYMSSIEESLRLRKGDKVHVEWYAQDSNAYNFHAKSGSVGYNRMQATYVGTEVEHPTWSGGCSNHGTGGGWKDMCLNHVDFASEGVSSYFTIASDGRVTFNRPGVYRIYARALIYSSNWDSHHGRILLNGKQIAYNHNRFYTWTMEQMDMYWNIEKGDVLQVQWHGREYSYHSFANAHKYSMLLLSFDGSPDSWRK